MFECSSIASLRLSATFTSCSDGRHIYSGVIRIETSTFQGRANIIGYLDLSGELTGCDDCDGRKVIRRLHGLGDSTHISSLSVLMQTLLTTFQGPLFVGSQEQSYGGIMSRL